MKIAINRSHKNKNPEGLSREQTKAFFREYNRHFSNEDLTIEDLIKEITTGWGIAAWHRNGYRHNRNFILAQHVGLDIDEGLGIKEALSHQFVSNHASFIYTTPSHTEKQHKFRIMFELDRPIKDKLKYSDLVQALMWHMDLTIDRVCKDPSRLFFGSEGAEVFVIDNVLSLETAAPIVQNWRKHVQEELDKKKAAFAGITSANVSQVRSNGLLAKLASHIRNCPDGEKYVTLRDISRTTGGYIATGVLNGSQAFDELWSAIRSRPSVKDWKLAEETIRKGIEFGMRDPLYLADRQATSDPWRGVTPTLSDTQKEQVNEIMRRMNSQAFLEGFHAGVNAATRTAWGLPDAILERYSLGYRDRVVNEETGEIMEGAALVVPYMEPDGDILNVEYRFNDGRFEYESDVPTLFYTEYESAQSPTIIIPDSRTCLDMYLNWGAAESDDGYWQFVGLPHQPITPHTLSGMVEPLVVVQPGDKLDSATVNALRNVGASQVTLPLSVGELIRAGVDEKIFSQYLMQRRTL